MTEKQVLVQAARDALSELQTGYLTESSASTPNVWTFGQMLVFGATQQYAEVARAARPLGLHLPTSAPAATRRLVGHLRSVSATAAQCGALAASVSTARTELSTLRHATSGSTLTEALISRFQVALLGTSRSAALLEQHVVHCR